MSGLPTRIFPKIVLQPVHRTPLSDQSLTPRAFRRCMIAHQHRQRENPARQVSPAICSRARHSV